jgi:hypothetical protein
LVARAQSPAPPYAFFQNATLTGSGNTLNATRVPVVTHPGQTEYVDLALEFSADTSGKLTLAPGFPQISLSMSLLVSNFKAGTYVASSTLLGGKNIIAVYGPGIAPGGATLWSLSAGSGADVCTTPIAAVWYDGPIASSPYAARLKGAQITSSAWSYGVGGGSGCGSPLPGLNNYAWRSSSLIGVSQTGNALTIASFSINGSTDHAVPQDQIVFTLHE